MFNKNNESRKNKMKVKPNKYNNLNCFVSFCIS